MKYIIQVLFIIITFNVCYGQEYKTYTIKTEKGKKIIENKAPLWKENRIELKFYRQIGKEEGNDENYLFNFPLSVAVDSKNNLYVFEAGNKRIQKFDKDLNYIKTIGRKGQGPGEFIIVRSAEIQRDTLYVESESSYKSTISVLTLDGKEIRRINITPISSIFHVTKKGLIISNNNSDEYNYLWRNNRILEGKMLAIYDGNGVFLKKFGDYFDYGNNDANNKNNSMQFVYDENDYIYFYYMYDNRVEKYSPDGEFIYRTYWPFNYDIPVPYKSIEQFNTRGGGIDHKNRIWVRMVNKLLDVKKVKTEDLTFAVFDKDGILLCFVPVPRKETIKIIGDSIFFINQDDTYCIYEYKIIEK